MLRTFAAIVAVAIATPVAAQPTVSGTFNLTINSQFNQVTNSYEPISVPIQQSMSFSIPLGSLGTTDYGTTTITQFGALGGTAFSSTLDAYSHPQQVASFGKNAYAFLGISDYPTDYITQFGIRSYDSGSIRNGNSYVNTQITITKYEPSRGGTGSADHPSTSADLVSFLTDYSAHPNNYNSYVFQQWGDYTYNPGGGATYSAGKSWDAYGRSVSLALTPAVPEPTTWAMMILGIGAVGYAMRRQRKMCVSYAA